KLSVQYLELDAHRDALSQIEQLRVEQGQWMNLQQAPLLKLQIVEDGSADRQYLLFQFHHMILDHVSMERIQQEIAAYMQGQHNCLPEAVQSRNYIAWAQYRNSNSDAVLFFGNLLHGL